MKAIKPTNYRVYAEGSEAMLSRDVIQKNRISSLFA